MRYYVIINGVNSLSIKGLAIKTLPSIIKPMMRTLREEIDGRNGDVITNLGYSAYDKQLEIGLYGEYDIDSIMAYFNQEGTIIFSDEDDKIYNFKILDQIDYAKLLKFRTAVVNLHIQPFKYPLEEEPIELIDTYVEEEGEELTLTPTEEAPMEITLKGNTSQVIIPEETGTEVEGTSISVNDVIPTKEDYITLKGNTSQVQYSGKNKFGVSDNTRTFHGILITTTNNKVSFSGTPDQDYVYTSNQTFNLPAGTYTCSSTNTSKDFFIWLKDSNNNTIGTFNLNGGTKTVTTSVDAVAVQYGIEHLTINTAINVETYFQIESGTTDTDYEPYVGGIPSPNPLYPQDIHSVSGDNEIEVCGENLFDVSTIEEKNISPNTGAVTSNSYWRTSAYIKVEPSTNYMSKWVNGTNAESYVKAIYYDKDKNFINGVSSDFILATNYGFTTPSNCEYIRYVYLVIINDTPAPKNDIQIVKGNVVPTTYEPYTGNTYHITLPNGMELNKIGTYQDYIYKSGSKWYLHKEIGKTQIVPSVASEWAFINDAFQSNNAVPSDIVDISSSISALCNNFIYEYHASGITGNLSNGAFGWNSSKKITFKIDGMTSKQDYIDWFTSNPTYVYYQLATPTYTEITDTTLISQLNVLYTATIYGTTNISSIPNDLEPFIDIKYNVVTPSPSPQRPSAIEVVSGTNTITIANQDSSETQTLQIRLGSIKLRYVDELQDYIYKSGDKWYIHALTGEKTFVGNSAEGWAMTSTPRGLKEFVAQISDMKKNSSIYCDNFTQVPETTQMAYETYTPSIATTNSKSVFIMLGDGSIASGSDFRTWLSTHNTTVVYPLNTAVDTEITDTDLLEDLEALLEATSYNPETNITQTNNDKPFILYAKALKQGSGEAIVENEGNIYAKPTFEIEGTGLVQVLIDNNEVLEVDTTNDTIVIDTESMEAINKTDGTLANRQVVGDYSKIKLNVGNNDVKLTGNYTKGTITKYTRYL